MFRAVVERAKPLLDLNIHLSRFDFVLLWKIYRQDAVAILRQESVDANSFGECELPFEFAGEDLLFHQVTLSTLLVAAA